MSDNRPVVPIAAAELDRLLDTLMVEFVRLSECLVGEGYRLELGGIDAPGLHYNLAGSGRLIAGDHAPRHRSREALRCHEGDFPRIIDLDRSGR